MADLFAWVGVAGGVAGGAAAFYTAVRVRSIERYRAQLKAEGTNMRSDSPGCTNGLQQNQAEHEGVGVPPAILSALGSPSPRRIS